MGWKQTSLDKTGSDAMNDAGDYSAAYCILKTDGPFEGHGMVSYLPFEANVSYIADIYCKRPSPSAAETT